MYIYIYTYNDDNHGIYDNDNDNLFMRRAHAFRFAEGLVSFQPTPIVQNIIYIGWLCSKGHGSGSGSLGECSARAAFLSVCPS